MIDGFELELLQTLFKYDDQDAIFWNCSGPHAPITFFIQCSDVFWWATADLEKITAEDLPLLKNSYEDEKELSGESFYGAILFCARKRGLRPQDPYLDRIGNTKIRELFEACGPKRKPEHQEMWHAWEKEN